MGSKFLVKRGSHAKLLAKRIIVIGLYVVKIPKEYAVVSISGIGHKAQALFNIPLHQVTDDQIRRGPRVEANSGCYFQVLRRKALV